MLQAERRRAHRRWFRAPLLIRMVHPPHPVAFFGESIDLSESGICFLTEQALEIGARLEISLMNDVNASRAPDAPKQWAGEVVYVSPKYTASGKARVGFAFEASTGVAIGMRAS